MNDMTKDSNRKYAYLFGPVPSRRLGISLGVDLVPAKTCSMDCIYCESGKTTDFTSNRSEFFPTSEIIAELDNYLAKSPEIDFITFSGAGEPTLHSGIGEIIKFLKSHYSEYKIALLTNAMMLTDKKVFQEVLPVDLIVPSLDAVESEIFSTINRPVCKVDCVELVSILARFKRESKALFYLEIFVVPGINDTPLSIDLLTAAVARIKPDKVQLNTLDRPGTEGWVNPASHEEMTYFAEKLAKVATVEVVGKFEQKKDSRKGIDEYGIAARIIGLVSRRPCTIEDLSESLGREVKDLRKILDMLVNEGKITIELRSRGEFYKIN